MIRQSVIGILLAILLLGSACTGGGPAQPLPVVEIEESYDARVEFCGPVEEGHGAGIIDVGNQRLFAVISGRVAAAVTRNLGDPEGVESDGVVCVDAKANADRIAPCGLYVENTQPFRRVDGSVQAIDIDARLLDNDGIEAASFRSIDFEECPESIEWTEIQGGLGLGTGLSVQDRGLTRTLMGEAEFETLVGNLVDWSQAQNDPAPLPTGVCNELASIAAYRETLIGLGAEQLGVQPTTRPTRFEARINEGLDLVPVLNEADAPVLARTMADVGPTVLLAWKFAGEEPAEEDLMGQFSVHSQFDRGLGAFLGIDEFASQLELLRQVSVASDRRCTPTTSATVNTLPAAPVDAESQTADPQAPTTALLNTTTLPPTTTSPTTTLPTTAREATTTSTTTPKVSQAGWSSDLFIDAAIGGSQWESVQEFEGLSESSFAATDSVVLVEGRVNHETQAVFILRPDGDWMRLNLDQLDRYLAAGSGMSLEATATDSQLVLYGAELMWTSYDGVNWTSAHLSDRPRAVKVFDIGDAMIRVGPHATGSDLTIELGGGEGGWTAWARHPASNNGDASDPRVSDVARGPRGLVLVANVLKIDSTTPSIWFASGLVEWIDVTPELPGRVRAVEWSDLHDAFIAFVDNEFGGASVFGSSNGRDWSAMSETKLLQSVVTTETGIIGVEVNGQGASILTGDDFASLDSYPLGPETKGSDLAWDTSARVDLFDGKRCLAFVESAFADSSLVGGDGNRSRLLAGPCA